MPTILLLEDELALREEVADFLCNRGHRVLQAGTLTEFVPLVPQARICLLDLMLPDGSGLDAARMVREQSSQAGIIMLTARGQLQDRIEGLRCGADHYLVKPFGLLELGAIIDALLRRVGSEWILDVSSGRLSDPEGRSMNLTPQELILVRCLCEAGAEPVSKRQLVESMGHDWSSYDLRRLDTLVSRLRLRWRREVGQELPLKTLHREGYGFLGVIERR
ncbi:MAG: response regulator transcription factor [Rubrivivax sp.]|jgi:DNA-binding response OmpR family regulator|nr:response regulator transcription factor [Rubrivivax sp.]